MLIFSTFWRLGVKMLDFGSAEELSWAQNGDQNRPSGAKHPPKSSVGTPPWSRSGTDLLPETLPGTSLPDVDAFCIICDAILPSFGRLINGFERHLCSSSFAQIL